MTLLLALYANPSGLWKQHKCAAPLLHCWGLRSCFWAVVYSLTSWTALGFLRRRWTWRTLHKTLQNSHINICLTGREGLIGYSFSLYVPLPFLSSYHIISIVRASCIFMRMHLMALKKYEKITVISAKGQVRRILNCYLSYLSQKPGQGQ